MIYLDTSALVKKYVVEEGTERIRDLLGRTRGIFTSKLTYAEVCASFARKMREGEIEKKHHHKVWASFLNDWESFFLIEVREEIFPLIRKLTEAYPLRGADAIHLSSALWVGREIGQKLTFVASDSNLLNASRSEGLKSVNPEGEKITLP